MGDAKRNIACNEKLRSFRSVDIVCIDTGTIYADEVNLSSFRTSGPILVMIGNEDRKFPSYLETDEKDPICPDGDEPRFLMPCRHATSMCHIHFHLLFVKPHIHTRIEGKVNIFMMCIKLPNINITFD